MLITFLLLRNLRNRRRGEGKENGRTMLRYKLIILKLESKRMNARRGLGKVERENENNILESIYIRYSRPLLN